MGLFGKTNKLDGFSTDALEEMSADAREDARHASRLDREQVRELRAEAAELEAEIEQRRKAGRP